VGKFRGLSLPIKPAGSFPGKGNQALPAFPVNGQNLPEKPRLRRNNLMH